MTCGISDSFYYFRDARRITKYKPTTTLRIEPVGDNRCK